MPKYLVSSTVADPDWNNTNVIAGDVVAEVKKLKEQVDGVIQVPGSIQLVQELIENDLVDEIHLMTFPVILGTGRRLFGETPDKTTWKLAESKTVGEGIPITIYQRAADN
jgi:dihydrofolate reductase